MKMTLLCYYTDTTIEMKDWIPLIAAIIGGSIVAIGWWVNGELNRKNEIAKELRALRLPTLQSFVEIYLIIQQNPAPSTDPTFLPSILKVHRDFYLYGQKDEIKLFETWNNTKTDTPQAAAEANAVLNKLADIVVSSIRKELNVKD